MPTASRSRGWKARAREAVADPAKFSRTFLRHDPWGTAEAVMRSVAVNQRTAVKACHASSKTFTAAEIVLWWISRYKNGLAITTAPTWTQVDRLLWGEIRKATATARIAFPDFGRTELRLDDGRETGDENFALGISTNQGVRFQGWHGGKLLIVVDEAVGLRPDIYEAIEGIRAGGDVRLLLLGNPTVPGGYFYEAFRQRRGWSLFTIDGLETPNLLSLGRNPEERLETLIRRGEEEGDDFLLDNVRPYLITRSYIFEKFFEWRANSPLWQARVRGQFPDQGADTYMPLSWLERARVPAPLPPFGAKFQAGIDVAGPGSDETSLTIRHENAVIHQKSWTVPDARGDVAKELREWGGQRRFTVLNIDTNGMGHYFAEHFADLGYTVEHINVGEGADDAEKFGDRKAEIHWSFRDRMEEGLITGITDDVTINQFASIRWAPNSKGQITIIGKQKMRSLGLPSPDRAESVILAFAPPRRRPRLEDMSSHSYVTG